MKLFASITSDRGQTDVIFLDFLKGFDRISHTKRLLNLTSIFKNEQLINWLGSYLTNSPKYVQIKGESAAHHPVPSGVPQGLVLGPLLFLFFLTIFQKTSMHKLSFLQVSVLYIPKYHPSRIN